MAISYEEALSTLEAMFGAPWTRETLDAVLRHEKGHMENTCDRILNHGSQDPQILIDRLKSGQTEASMDEELARQMQARQSGRRGGDSNSTPAPAPSPAPAKKGRGTPTELPKDFLRIPGYNHRTTNGTGTGTAVTAGDMDDETLARMLQDELFSEELARNPDFAHLARGARSGRTGASRRGVPPGQRRSGTSNQGPPPPNPFEGVNVMENISKLGEGARRRLQMFAVNFENRLNGRNQGDAGGGSSTQRAGVLQEDSGAVAERRGLLDDDDGEEEIEFEMREKKSN